MLINKKTPLQKELEEITKKEAKLLRKASENSTGSLRENLEDKIPEKVYTALRTAFAKAFEVVFKKGDGLLNRTINSKEIERKFRILDYAVENGGTKKEYKELQKSVSGSNSLNTLISAAEGIGLGVLGIGLPDIVLWLGFLLRGVYEVAQKYGFSCNSLKERYFVLKLLEASMSRGKAFKDCNRWVDLAMELDLPEIAEAELDHQISRTAEAFASRLLLMKFIQGIPIAGAAGGAFNPVYYRRIVNYAELKYRKRYLLGKENRVKK